VVPYRGGILEILDLAAKVSTNCSHVESDVAEKRKVVVVQHQNRLIGFAVKEIFEMSAYTKLHTDIAQPDCAILGHFFVGEQTVGLLDVEGILTEANVAADNPDESTIAVAA
jgi:chemotaxis signal transduction protein